MDNRGVSDCCVFEKPSLPWWSVQFDLKQVDREPMRVREREPKPEKKKINLPWWPVQFDLKQVERAYERKREPKTVNEKTNRA